MEEIKENPQQYIVIGWVAFAVQSTALNIITKGNNDIYLLGIAIVSFISTMFLFKGK